MAEPNPPPPPAPPSSPAPDALNQGEISLEDIDRLLQAEDPDFAKSLEEVRNVQIDKNVHIETAAIDETLSGEEKFERESQGEKGWTKFKAKIALWWLGLRTRLRARLFLAVKDSVIFLRTRPKELALYSIVIARALAKQAVVPVKAFQEASRKQQLTIVLLIAMGVASAVILIANFRGIWLPSLNQPLLRSFEPYADRVVTYDEKDGGESFYTAFPQELYEYLFPKMKVNLRRTSENPDPMGAFEIVAELDSKDTAIEVSDRVVEFSDLLQRVLEQESFNDMESELGKSRLKNRLKRVLDQQLTQGWVKDIHFKTFILKP